MIDLQRVVAVSVDEAGADPEVQVAGTPDSTSWRDLDPFLRARFEEAQDWPPLSVQRDRNGGAVGPLDGNHDGAVRRRLDRAVATAR